MNVIPAATRRSDAISGRAAQSFSDDLPAGAGDLDHKPTASPAHGAPLGKSRKQERGDNADRKAVVLQ
jgi:hypothetical protein